MAASLGRGCSAVYRTVSARSSGLTIEASPEGTALYAADTDGQVFESLNEGETWTVIADAPPVSKGEFYRALAKAGQDGQHRRHRDQPRANEARAGGGSGAEIDGDERLRGAGP